MFLITIKGIASTDYSNIQKLDGIDCQDNFAEYFHGKYGENMNEQSLIDKGIKSGYMRFKYENEQLWTLTEYESQQKLTDEELNIIADYTQGQWSDGIGEGFEQFPCMYDGDNEVYISPWSTGQKLFIEQCEI